MSRQWQVFTADKVERVQRAWSKYYDALARHFLAQTKVKPFSMILEAGCGKGQLTLPLLNKLPRSVKLIALDSSKGPYRGWLDELASKLNRSRFDGRVRLIRSDVRLMKSVNDDSVDLIVSNELLCDLQRKTQIARALDEFYRILRPGGTMIHGEWSSSPIDQGQGFKVKHSPAWNPDQLFNHAKQAGFHDFRVSYFDATVSLGHEVAIEELRSWGVTERFLKHYERSVARYGIQIPYEHVIQCEK